MSTKSYVLKGLADTRYAATQTIGTIDPDPAAPPVTADARIRRLAQTLEIPPGDLTLPEIEALAAEAIGAPLPAATTTKRGR